MAGRSINKAVSLSLLKEMLYPLGEKLLAYLSESFGKKRLHFRAIRCQEVQNSN